MATLSTYISFPGNAQDAFEFYHSTFGGELTLLTYADADLADFPFVTDPQAVAHAMLSLPGGAITGGDDFTEADSLAGGRLSVLYTFDSIDEAKARFDDLLAAGGTEVMPFALAPWGDFYGQVQDHFGLVWAINVAGPDKR